MLAAAGVVAVPAALHLTDRFEAEAQFDAAVTSAATAGTEAQAALAAWETAVDAANLHLEDARAVASAGVGYLDAAALEALVAANSDVDEALAVDVRGGSPMPSTERPTSAAELRDSAKSLDLWSTDSSELSASVLADAASVDDLTVSSADAVAAAIDSVTAHATSALAVAPIASAETRSALEAARDALLAAAKGDEPRASYVSAYAAAVEAAFASQRAEEAAAAAREAEANAEARADTRARLDLFLHDLPPFDICDHVFCVDGIVVGVS